MSIDWTQDASDLVTEGHQTKKQKVSISTIAAAAANTGDDDGSGGGGQDGGTGKMPDWNVVEIHM